MSEYILGIREQHPMQEQLRTANRGVRGAIAGEKHVWTSHWWATDPAIHAYYFAHDLGVVPTEVDVRLVVHEEADTSHAVLGYGAYGNDTTTRAMEMTADPVLGAWVGYEITHLSKYRVGIVWADWMGYSEGKDNYQWTSDGWMRLGDKTAFKIVLRA